MNKKQQFKTRKGAASIFVVIFTTLLLSIITLSFVRIMLSEAGQTTNYDLSQSAYDSALAGIEDAKIALLKYQECLSKGATANSGTPECRKAITAMLAEGATDNCDIISDMLTRPNTGEETIIQSEEGTSTGASGEVMDQAYTCVKIDEDTPDYISTLNQNYQSKMVPIRTANNDSIEYLEFQWFNDVDKNKASASIVNFAGLGSGSFNTNKLGYSQDFSSNNFSSASQAPPVIRFKFMQTSTEFTLAELDTNSGSNTNRGTLLLRPSTNGINQISNSASTGLAASADKSLNNPIDVKCNKSSYVCSLRIYLPRPIAHNGVSKRDDATSFVFVSLPYGQPETTFSITLYDKNGNRIPFTGVQSKIDSTGRANDLFRRIEARLEMVDIYYPFPEYGVNLSSNDDDSIWKSFYVTRNCWTSNGQCNNSGTVN